MKRGLWRCFRSFKQLAQPSYPGWNHQSECLTKRLLRHRFLDSWSPGWAFTPGTRCKYTAQAGLSTGSPSHLLPVSSEPTSLLATVPRVNAHPSLKHQGRITFKAGGGSLSRLKIRQPGESHVCFQDRTKQGCFVRAYRDVLAACPENKHGTPLADRSRC